MARRLPSLLALAAFAIGGCAGTVDPSRIPFESAAHRAGTERALARWTTTRLTRFTDEAQFRRYLRDVRAAGRARGEWWARLRSDDRGEAADETIIVTGSRIPPRNASITNVQDAGVDEGDIVKQIDRFLLVLQDGRIFVVDTGTGAGAPMVLTDRVNVYRDPESGMWYDEMLVHGDRIVVAGYSYEQEVAELAVFRLSPDGRIAAEGVFHISADDYYDPANYATRLVDGNLLIYTPLDLTALELDEEMRWPAIRRWRPGTTPALTPSDARPMFGADQVYRPTITAFTPTIHTVSVCPLGPEMEGRDLECRSTGFAGPAFVRYYVSRDAAYLWLLPNVEDDAALIDAAACTTGRPAPRDNVLGMLHRIPHDEGEPGILGVRGAFFDHFAMQERDGAFRALVSDVSVRCEYESAEDLPPLNFTFFTTPVSAFGQAVVEAAAEGYTPLPGVDARAGQVIDRFTDRYVMYGRLGQLRYWAESDEPPETQIVVVPVERPQEARRLTVPHNIVRAEQAGEDMFLSGYRGPSALRASLIDLSGEPRLASTHALDGRYESEGRSHAFNAWMRSDGSGLLGLPTVALAEDGERMPWWSRSSDMDFLGVDRNGRLSGLGRVSTGPRHLTEPSGRSSQLDGEPDEDDIPGYSCEVSCVDWYGNSRPIFTDGRIFALIGHELVEARIVDGRVEEVRRVNLATDAIGR
jgi:beta propeller domain-containing protein